MAYEVIAVQCKACPPHHTSRKENEEINNQLPQNLFVLRQITSYDDSVVETQLLWSVCSVPRLIDSIRISFYNSENTKILDFRKTTVY